MKKYLIIILSVILNSFNAFAIIPTSEEDLKKEYRDFVSKLPPKNIQNMLNAYYYNDGDIYREMAIEECENIGESCNFSGIEFAARCISEKMRPTLDVLDSKNFTEESFIKFNRAIESSMNYCGNLYLNYNF